jgi:hypothetical protein
VVLQALTKLFSAADGMLSLTETDDVKAEPKDPKEFQTQEDVSVLGLRVEGGGLLSIFVCLCSGAGGTRPSMQAR